MPKKRCVECRWWELKIGPAGRSYYWCRKTGQVLAAAILQRPACDNFACIEPAPHWGP